MALAAWRHPVEPILRRLKCSTAEIARGRAIDRGPAEPMGRSMVAIRQWLSAVGPAANDLMHVRYARSGAPADWLNEVVVIRVNRDPLHRSDLAVTGSDLVDAGVATPGPELGALLDQLVAHVLRHPEDNQHQVLLETARKVPRRE